LPPQPRTSAYKFENPRCRRCTGSSQNRPKAQCTGERFVAFTMLLANTLLQASLADARCRRQNCRLHMLPDSLLDSSSGAWSVARDASKGRHTQRDCMMRHLVPAAMLTNHN
jgi:hypothetical protein